MVKLALQVNVTESPCVNGGDLDCLLLNPPSMLGSEHLEYLFHFSHTGGVLSQAAFT